MRLGGWQRVLMEHPNQLDYYVQSRSRPRPATVWTVWALLVFLPLAIFGLFKLQRMPYRPPADMSTLLTSDEIRAVWLLMAALSIVWIVAAVFAAKQFWSARGPGGARH